MFADDIELYRTIHSFEDCLILQININILLDWSKHWLLSLNAKFYIFGIAPFTGNYTIVGAIR